MKWDAEDYSRNSRAQQTWARELIAKLHLVAGESVLDIGCGDGKVTAEIASLVGEGRVVGIDSSPEMVAFAGRTVGGSSPNVVFSVGDARELSFDREFDVVFSNATLHWVIDHRPVLRGISRALKRGGRLLLQMGGRDNAADILALMDSLPSDPGWGCYFSERVIAYGFYGPEDYVPWLREAGLTPVRVELLERDMAQPGKAGLASWVRTTWLPFTQRVPEERRDDFVSDIVDRYVESHPPDGEGRLHVRMVRLEVEALKKASSEPS